MMEVVARMMSFPVAGRVWQPRPGSFALTFVCKATYTLAPGKLEIAPDQEPVNEVDRPWSDSVTSLYAASDLAPSKPAPDVVLIGNAFAPGGVPTQKVVARLAIGEVDKSIEVWADRTLRADGSVAEGSPFTTMPLLYERAAAGPDNPVGMTFERDAYGEVALPNLTRPGTRVAHDAPIAPVGFGPIAAYWPARLARMGRIADALSLDHLHEQPLPADLDPGCFNVAPLDQRPTTLRGDETLVLENLHREHPKLTMKLPGTLLQAKLSSRGGEKALELSCDTLWIDTSRGICCLTYRGQVPIASPTDAGWVIITPARQMTMLDPGETGRHRAVDVPFQPAPAPPAPVTRTEPPPKRQRAATMPIAIPPPASEPRNVSVDAAVPFRPAASSFPSEASFAMGSRVMPSPAAQDGPPSAPTAVVLGGERRSDDAMPFRRDLAPLPQAPTFGAPPPPVFPPASFPMVPPPAPNPAPPAPVPPAPAPPTDSPWAIAPAPSGVGTIAPVTAAPASAPVAGDFRDGGGALLASNAAAGVVEGRSAPRVEPVRPLVIPTAPRSAPREPGDVLDLLFYDADSLPRIRRVAGWRKILEDLEDRPLEAEEDDPAAAKEPEQIEDRREVLELLVRAPPSDVIAVEDSVVRAARDDGRFLPPIVIVSGELSTPFDEVETLRATLTIVTPLAGNDENLKASIEIAKDLLKLPGLSSSPQVVEGMTTRLREAFAQAKRPLQPAQLDAQVERALVEQRFYQHRKVLGGRRQRTLFHFSPPASGDGSASKAGGPLVTYLPDSVESKLPLFARFKARLIARVHLPLDPYEQGSALEALALARLCPAPRREQK
jgi:hypothetical protein